MRVISARFAPFPPSSARASSHLPPTTLRASSSSVNKYTHLYALRPLPPFLISSTTIDGVLGDAAIESSWGIRLYAELILKIALRSLCRISRERDTIMAPDDG